MEKNDITILQESNKLSIFEYLKSFTIKRIEQLILPNIDIKEAEKKCNYKSISKYDDKKLFIYELYAGILSEIELGIQDLDICECDFPFEKIISDLKKVKNHKK